MALYITIDGGTTNTRISLVDGMKTIDRLGFNIGAKSNIDGNALYKKTIKEGILKILANNSLKESDIARILTSGMITSEFGLLRLDHITAPAGTEKLHNNMKEVTLKEISDIPFVFIRGVKTDSDSLEDSDVMCGEESELMGIADKSDGECIYVLPGSHSKIIKTGSDGRIIKFSTMLTGEMLAALSQNTILRDAVDLEKSALDREYLLVGFDFCRRNGINKSLFKVRILKNVFGQSKDCTYSFFLGAVLCEEITEIIKINSPKILIGGRRQLKEAMYEILKNRCSSEVVCIPSEKIDCANSRGMVKIYEYNGQKQKSGESNPKWTSV